MLTVPIPRFATLLRRFRQVAGPPQEVLTYKLVPLSVVPRSRSEASATCPAGTLSSYSTRRWSTRLRAASQRLLVRARRSPWTALSELLWSPQMPANALNKYAV